MLTEKKQNTWTLLTITCQLTLQQTNCYDGCKMITPVQGQRSHGTIPEKYYICWHC